MDADDKVKQLQGQLMQFLVSPFIAGLATLAEDREHAQRFERWADAEHEQREFYRRMAVGRFNRGLDVLTKFRRGRGE